MAAPLYTTASGRLWHAGNILIVCVGLPVARGKTHIARAIERYLRWMGVKIKVFSLGDYRRRLLGGAQQLPPDYFTLGEKSPETAKLRTSIREGCEQMVVDFFNKEGGQVAIYDANNGTKQSRKTVGERFEKLGVHVIFLESMCDNQDIVISNIRSVKISSPDYKGWDPEKAIEDYMLRIKDHEIHYEEVDETNWPHIKIINVGEKIMINKIYGYLQTRIIFFLMNIHNKYRTIYFARSGQSLIEHSYKADSDLSEAGWEYSEKLMNFVLQRREKHLAERKKLGTAVDENKKLTIWTSTRRRSHHTAWPFQKLGYRVVEKNQMCEINPGVWDGLSPELARERYPDEWARFLRDPYAHRAPRAESYHDLCVRLEPIIVELEHEQDDLLIITHASVIRCLLAYLIGLPSSEVPAVEIARGDLIQVTPTSYGVHINHGKSDIPTIEEQEETHSVKSVDEAKTFSEAAAIQKATDTGDTVFTVPVSGL
ncbi:Bifunctional 6-phosphofructo-2-kinase fructose-2,6-bisphosphate 2-phosphatase [Rhizoctonia solani]|uniref:Bifunctional 6-phosphofructo-2-kinase fructose-2,6-bisphosphate 2-phosphatase n=1 Tax=Rhizoctonia solani TaxID=456999 RepID=A0A8H7IBX8_9AGAM|nr:Bifunctional 6-phosphofructo-2-kinase fructose-2,6-bisphosphate 2-phosphatase [Rhizoctonia solani]